MIRLLLKISLYLGGYLSLGFGLLILIAAFKMLYNVLPEIVIAQGLGTILVLLGSWLLDKRERLFRRPQ